MRIKLSVGLPGVALNLKRKFLWGAIAMFIAGLGPAAPASAAMVQQAELTASDGMTHDRFGGEVSLSSDGNTALVGARGADSYKGAAYVYVRLNGTWSQQARLTSSDIAAGYSFGWATALSGDGNTALIGATAEGYIGAAYVFIRTNGGWSQQQKITLPAGSPATSFAIDVALSNDGSTALVSTLGDGAFVFKRIGGIWTYHSKISVSSPQITAYFGHNIALDGDGTVALISAQDTTVDSRTDQGVVYVFAWNSNTNSWGWWRTLTASDGAANDRFGISVALNGNGNVAVIGTTKTINSNLDQGAAYVFDLNSSFQQRLAASDGAASDFFGAGVSVNSDGTIVMVKSPFRNLGQGAAYLFRKVGSSWMEEQILTGGGSSNNEQGGDGGGLVVSSDGSTAFLGAAAKFSYKGAGYVFVTEISIYTSTGAGGTVSCSPNPVKAHMDSVCSITPDANYRVSQVQIAPVGLFWLTVNPTTRYAFENIVYPYRIDATFVAADIWLYRRLMFSDPPWEYQYTQHTIADAILDAAIWHTLTDTIRIPSGAFKEGGGIFCTAAVDLTLSGGWMTQTGRDPDPMSSIRGPLTINPSCSLALDRITVE